MSLIRSAETMDSVLDQMFSFGYYLMKDEELKLLGMKDYKILKTEYSDFLERKVRPHVRTQEYIDSVYIYMENKGCLLEYFASVMNNDKSSLTLEQIRDVKDAEWLDEYHRIEDNVYVLQSRKRDGSYPYLLSMILSGENCGAGFEGEIIINLNMKDLGNVLGYTKKDDQIFFMINEENEILYTNRTLWIKDNMTFAENRDFLVLEENASSIGKLKREEYYISKAGSDKNEFQYVFCSPLMVYVDRMERVDMLLGMLIIISCLIGILISYIVTIHSYRPIQHIVDRLEDDGLEEMMVMEFQGEGLNGEVEKNELQYIARMIQNTRLRNQRFQMEAKEWMQKLSRSQMYALQSQINPHYLYNTLDAINWEAIEKLGENNSVSDMLNDLAQFLRISLQSSGYLASVEEELDHAKLYGKIIKSRYGESVHLLWSVDEEVMQYKMLRLSLQPLLENAVIHGLRKKRYEGNIVICGFLMDDMVVLSVEDDGVGMSEEECYQMNQELLNDYESESRHMGIRNVNQRMKILFGDEYGINLMCREEGGLSVRLLFPK